MKNAAHLQIDANGVNVPAIALHNDLVYQEHGWISTINALQKFILKLGSYALSVAENIENKMKVFEDISKLMIIFCYKLDCLVIFGDEQNAPRTNLIPPVLPPMLNTLSPHEFFEFVSEQRERLLVNLDPAEVERIAEEFLQLRKGPKIATGDTASPFN